MIVADGGKGITVSSGERVGRSDWINRSSHTIASRRKLAQSIMDAYAGSVFPVESGAAHLIQIAKYD